MLKLKFDIIQGNILREKNLILINLGLLHTFC